MKIRYHAGNSLLHHAVECDSVEIIKYLIEKGMKISDRNRYGETPIFSIRSTNALILLIKNGADINVKKSFGRTPLHFLIPFGRVHLVEYLIKSGARVDIKDDYGKTVIDVARENGLITHLSNIIKKYRK